MYGQLILRCTLRQQQHEVRFYKKWHISTFINVTNGHLLKPQSEQNCTELQPAAWPKDNLTKYQTAFELDSALFSSRCL